jgi:hypothetical protein
MQTLSKCRECDRLNYCGVNVANALIAHNTRRTRARREDLGCRGTPKIPHAVTERMQNLHLINYDWTCAMELHAPMRATELSAHSRAAGIQIIPGASKKILRWVPAFTGTSGEKTKRLILRRRCCACRAPPALPRAARSARGTANTTRNRVRPRCRTSPKTDRRRARRKCRA